MAFTYFVDDPVIGPTHAEKTQSDSTVKLRSMGYLETDAAPSFVVVFEPALAGAFDTAKTTPAVGTGSLGATTFMSQPVGKFQQVVIKLKKKTHPGQGYKYTIVMNGKALDPRVIPR